MFTTTVAVCTVFLAAGVDREPPKRVVQGDICCRVLLIDFEGREHVQPREAFETIFFQNQARFTPGPFPEAICGSARDYFGELSNGRLRLSGEVMPWVRSRLKFEDLPHWTQKPRNGSRDWWQPVVVDAMSLNNIPKDDQINGKKVNFYAVIYAGSSRGYLKCVNRIVFAGAGRRSLSSRVSRKTKVPHWEDRWNGKQITFNPERLRPEPSGVFGVGLLFHELGHMLGGFRDLYGEDNGDFGRYAIMAYGDKTHFPTGPTAFNRAIAGWLSYDVPAQQGRHMLRLPPLQMQRAVKLVNGPMPWADALVVEYRVRSCPQETFLPAEGLLVYEISGHRRVRIVRWDAKTKRPAIREQRQRVLRADGTPKNEAGDVFREGALSLFGNPPAASSATGCGFWELDNIRLPQILNRQPPSFHAKGVAAFNAIYRPECITPRVGSSAVDLTSRLSPGDHRLYVRVAGGAYAFRGDGGAELTMPSPSEARPAWGLLDVHVPAERRRLSVVPGPGARIEEVQIVPRVPVLLNLLASPHAGPLTASCGGRVVANAALADNVWVGGAIEVPLSSSQSSGAGVPLTCPGGVLRLALRSFPPDKRSSSEVTLLVRDGGKEHAYLNRAALRGDCPEFILVDCRHLRGKPIQVKLQFKGPAGGRVVVWEAAFTAR